MSRRPKLFVFLQPCFAFLLLAGSLAAQTPDPGVVSRHLQQAQHLVVDLKGAEENVYGGGKRHINWEPGHYAARTVCSSFMTLLLQHTYGWRNEDFKLWLASTNPEADAYHDAIVEGRGFQRLGQITALRPGDVVAVKYADHHVSSNGVEDTGHVMLVSDAPQSIADAKPIISGTHQYTVGVIDSSASGHGPTDTRYHSGRGLTGGIGQGVIRLYADNAGNIMGYTWSDTPKSPYYTGPARDIVAGRLSRVLNATAP